MKRTTNGLSKDSSFECNHCKKTFTKLYLLKRHNMYCKHNQIPSVPDKIIENISRFTAMSALNSSVQYIRFQTLDGVSMIPRDFFHESSDLINETIELILKRCAECKVHPFLKLRMIKTNSEGIVEAREDVNFSLKSVRLEEFDINYVLNKLEEQIAIYVRNGSNWNIEGVIFFDLRVTQYSSIRHLAGRGSNSFSLPPHLKKRNAVINVSNSGDDCFRYAVLSLLHYDELRKQYRSRPSSYKKWMDEHNWFGITFPFSADQIPLFESNNNGLYINLYQWNDAEESAKLIRKASKPKDAPTISKVLNILLVKLENGCSHYVGIVDIKKIIKENVNNLKLPEGLKNKKAVVNVLDQTDDSFKYALLSVLHYKEMGDHERREALTYEKLIDRYNWESVKFPMTKAQLTAFERDNPGIYIHLMEWTKENSVIQLRAAPKPKKAPCDSRYVSLLCFKKNKTEEYHYVGVTSIDRLLNTKNGEENYHKNYCLRCLKPFFSKKSLEEHFIHCEEEVTLKMPKKNMIKFENYKKMERLPYCVYIDSECILKKDSSNSNIVHHVPIAIGVLLVAHSELENPLDIPYKAFDGLDCVHNALKYIEDISKQVFEWNQLYFNRTLEMTYDDEKDFRLALNCYLCKEKFNDQRTKVREHDHLNGKFRGAACVDCNSKLKVRKNVLPVICHNFKNYDSHLLCENGLGKMKDWKLNIIPNSSEKYVAIMASYPICTRNEKTVYMNIEFKDSCLFLQESLESLAKNLQDCQLVNAKKCLPENACLDLVSAKGIFPYEFLDCIEKLDEKELPPREMFYDNLNKEECSERDYSRAVDSWKIFGCETLKDYMLSYMSLDIHLLADVFEAFRKMVFFQDKLEALHYFTLPGITWDSAFLSTNTAVEAIQENEMYEFISSGIRGGMVVTNSHIAQGNSKYLPDQHDPSKEQVEILYLDQNNLYGASLSMKLPKNNFKWLTSEECETLRKNIVSMDLDGDEGYLLECDLIYPENIHEATKDLPFAPERLKIDKSNFTTFMHQQIQNERYVQTKKLTLNQWDKEGYVIHAKLLQFFMKHGMQISRIKRGLKFYQEAYFEPYISFNSKHRKNASNTFEKNYFKLKNNSLFGKTCEEVKKRINFRLCNNSDELCILTSKPSFERFIIFNENLVGVCLAKESILLNKPIYIGQAILDLSKLIMYEMFYDQLKPMEKKFEGSKIDLLAGDTDSFILKLVNIDSKTQFFPALKNTFDSSNYPVDHELFSEDRKAKLLCFKDESAGIPISEILMARPKCYSILYSNNHEMKRAKGVRRPTLKKLITHDDYKKAFNDMVELSFNETRIASKKHHLMTLTYSKKAISFFEDKRVWLNHNESLPYGNCKIPAEIRAKVKKENTMKVIPQMAFYENEKNLKRSQDEIVRVNEENPSKKLCVANLITDI